MSGRTRVDHRIAAMSVSELDFEIKKYSKTVIKLSIRLTPEELELINRAADKAGVGQSALALQAALQASRQILSEE